MTQVGIVHLLSALYLSAVISLAVSLNENREPGRILSETLRRWIKFLLIGTAVGLVIAFVVLLFA